MRGILCSWDSLACYVPYEKIISELEQLRSDGEGSLMVIWIINESVQYICDNSDFPLIRMACDVPIKIVLPGDPAAKFKAVFAPLNVTKVCFRLFKQVRMF